MASPSDPEGRGIDVTVAPQRLFTSVNIHISDPLRGLMTHEFSSAGLDTTQSALFAFLVAMSLYLDVQTKAQMELDRVLGQKRLPLISDMESLPYISAIVKETRWHTTGPLGIPHAVVVDDEYNGYRIPKDSVIIANAWAILHDPEVYPKPDIFIPGRFLKDGEPSTLPPDPTVAFGYGRRACPGRHYATAALFIYMASILHTFRIAPPLDENGKPIQIQPRPTTGLVSFLEDSRCTLTPRSAWAEALIRRETDTAVSK